MKNLLPLMLACFGTSLAFAQANPCEWYRFENDDNVPVLAYSIPPDLVHKGYLCIGKDGSAVEVPRELTQAEIAKRDRDLEEKNRADAERATRKRQDQELVRLYASAKDVEEARDRKVRSIENAIATTTSNVERLKVQKQRLEGQAADREREGLAPSPDILANLKNLETQIADKEREVASRKAEKQQVIDQFAFDLERIKLLYGVAPSDAPAKSGTAAASEPSKNAPAKSETPPANTTAKSETPR